VLIAFCEAIKVHLSESPLCLAVTGQRNLSLANPRLIAGAIAWRIRHLLATTLVGLGMLWSLQWLFNLLTKTSSPTGS
jgi:hypothetical protein